MLEVANLLRVSETPGLDDIVMDAPDASVQSLPLKESTLSQITPVLYSEREYYSYRFRREKTILLKPSLIEVTLDKLHAVFRIRAAPDGELNFRARVYLLSNNPCV